MLNENRGWINCLIVEKPASEEFLCSTHFRQHSQVLMSLIGKPAILFELADTTGLIHRLQDSRGRWLISAVSQAAWLTTLPRASGAVASTRIPVEAEQHRRQSGHV